MAKERNGIVISDDLFSEYHKYKRGEEHNHHVIKRLLHYYKGEIISNIAQYQRCNVDLDRKLEISLRKADLKQQNLEELAENHTLYKIILNTERSDFPYVNIMDEENEKIENNYSSSYDVADSRKKALLHLKAICSHAKEIIVYDKYFSCKSHNVETLIKLLPRKKVDIYYNHISNSDILKMQSVCNEWNFVCSQDIKNKHDRYIIINKSIEIILSSGFDHLSQTSEDFTYIIRPIKGLRF